MNVYKITNLINEKIYVGQTKFSVKKRFKEHAKADSLIGRAIRKYGEEYFDYEVIETCETREEAYELEIYFIQHFNCMTPNGYNLTEGGLCYPNFESFPNGDGWVIMYREPLLNLAIKAPLIAWKVFATLASQQNFNEGIKITKRAIADILGVSYDNVLRGFNWLKDNGYVKERKVNGITEFLLNPNVTTCGKNRKNKKELWDSIQ